jgi:hypothetical protein
MSISLEDALLNVWRQSLVENKRTVMLEGRSFPLGRAKDGVLSEEEKYTYRVCAGQLQDALIGAEMWTQQANIALAEAKVEIGNSR